MFLNKQAFCINANTSELNHYCQLKWKSSHTPAYQEICHGRNGFNANKVLKRNNSD